MRKTVALFLLIVFAVASLLAVGLLTAQLSEENFDFFYSYSNVSVGDSGDVEPQGIEIDTPGGPG